MIVTVKWATTRKKMQVWVGSETWIVIERLEFVEHLQSAC